MKRVLQVLVNTIVLAAAMGHAQTIQTIAGGYNGDGRPAAEASFLELNDIHGDGSNLYLADAHRIRRIDAATGVITTLAGSGEAGYSGDGGPAAEARVGLPLSVTTGPDGNVLFADLNNRVRRIDVRTGTIETLAGTGIEGFAGDGAAAIDAQLARPRAVVADENGTVYVADESLRIRRIDATTGVITTYAGTGSLMADYEGSDGRPAIEADLGVIQAMALAADGTLYFDLNRRVVAKIDPTTGTLSRIAGQHEHTRFDSGDGGPALDAKLSAVRALAVDASGDLYVATNYRVHKVDTKTGVISTIAGAGYGVYSGDGGAAIDAHLSDPTGLWVDADGNVLVADRGNHRLRRVEATTGLITTVAGGHGGDGRPALEASFSGSFSVAPNGDILVADAMNYRVRRIDAQSGHISTVAGTGLQRETAALMSPGPAREVSLWRPVDVATNAQGTIYVADGLQVLRLDPQSGQLAAFAGNGQLGAYAGDGQAALEIAMFPFAIAAGPLGDLFVIGLSVVSPDWGRVLKVDAKTGIISTVAGGDSSGFSGDGGPAVEARLGVSPRDLLVTSDSDLYIADGSRVRFVDGDSGQITTIAGNGDYEYSGDGGPATEAGLEEVSALALDDGGNLFLFSGLRVRRVDAHTGVITSVAGNGQFGDSGDGGSALQAGLYPGFPGSLGVDRSGGLLIGGRGRIRRVSGVITAVLGMESVLQRPLHATLQQNYPNPFNAGTMIRLSLPRSEKIDLRVYNMAAQRVATLASGHHAAGAYSLHWDGRGDEGTDLASGVYLYRLVTEKGQVMTRKFVLVR